MTAASDGGAKRRTARAAGVQARQRRHPHHIAHAVAPADPLLDPEEPGPFGFKVAHRSDRSRWHRVRAMRNAKQTPEQHRADFVAAQEFHQIQKFAAACGRQWPGAKIVLRPNQDGAPAGAKRAAHSEPHRKG